MGRDVRATDLARAGAYLGQVNIEIIKAAGQRRQGHRGQGDRAPASIEAEPVQLRALSRPTPDGKPDPITPLGYQTAVRRLPRLLARLDPSDPRRRAAIMLANTAERIGAVGSIDLQGTGTKSATPDGGVTTKVKHATRLRMIEAYANGWQIERNGRINRAAERVALPIRRKGQARQEIKAYDALVAICVHGHSVSDVLSHHGWAVQTKNVTKLGGALLDVLADIGDGLGFGRPSKEEA